MQRFCFLLLWPLILFSQNVVFDDFFENHTMRVDYYHTGAADEDIITIDQIYKQGIWAGTTTQLIDPFDLGIYCLKVYDRVSSQLIYSRGFATYFSEYQTTEPAKKGIRKTYHETVLFPYPKKPVLMVLEKRNRNNILQPFFEWEIDPADYHINDEAPDRGDRVINVLDHGHPHKKVDLVILGDGYTNAEEKKFENDLKKYTDVLFTIEPFQSNKTRFNVRGIFSPSMESGTDEPTKGIYKNTVLNTTFNSLDSPRYLLTEDNKTMRNIAAQVPYDLAFIMVNIERYGGGGIYNTLATFTASEVPWNEYVFVHEFGHFFAGLADEYYTSSVAYDEFYPRGVEPLEANITSLPDPENVKWKQWLTPGLAIPTDWGKAEFDSLNKAVEFLRGESNRRRQEWLDKGANPAKLDSLSKVFTDSIAATSRRINAFISDHPLRGKIGVFEGAGYSAEGLYRPTVNSIMHKFDEKDWSFYKVSEAFLQRMIDYYCE